jgi:hypothetical protein
VTFEEWKGAVDEAFEHTDSGLRVSALDRRALRRAFNLGLEPVIAARHFATTSRRAADPEAWICASPKWMRLIGAVIIGAALLGAVVSGMMLIVLLAAMMGYENGIVTAVSSLGLVTLLWALVCCAILAGFGQLVLAGAEAVEHLRR